MTVKQIIVVGAGASGLMAAGRAAEMGARVLLLEKTPQPGQKLLISGKSRCNITNSKYLDEFIAMYGDNGRFLYSAFRHFFREDLLELLKRYGVETKTERGGRIFPASDDARDVVAALQKYTSNFGVELHSGTPVNSITVKNGIVIGVQSGKTTFPADAVILAAGGASYPTTGSDGSGYRLAAQLGHNIIKLRPALVPLIVEEIELAKSMQGVSLRNVRLTAYQCKAKEIDLTSSLTRDYGRGIAGKKPSHPIIESRMGEMMMTHFGIGGPITLLMSLAIVDALEKGPVSVALDLKPALDKDKLRQRLQRDFDTHGKREFRNILKELLPQKLIDPFISLVNISEDKPGNQISGEEKERLVQTVKCLRFNIKGPLPISNAIVTAGGVSLKEVDPQTMASRRVKGLYLCGEVLDIDADTGGYNLQAAFSTGYAAGEAAARYLHDFP